MVTSHSVALAETLSLSVVHQTSVPTEAMKTKVPPPQQKAWQLPVCVLMLGEHTRVCAYNQFRVPRRLVVVTVLPAVVSSC